MLRISPRAAVPPACPGCARLHSLCSREPPPILTAAAAAAGARPGLVWTPAPRFLPLDVPVAPAPLALPSAVGLYASRGGSWCSPQPILEPLALCWPQASAFVPVSSPHPLFSTALQWRRLAAEAGLAARRRHRHGTEEQQLQAGAVDLLCAAGRLRVPQAGVSAASRCPGRAARGARPRGGWAPPAHALPRPPATCHATT